MYNLFKIRLPPYIPNRIEDISALPPPPPPPPTHTHTIKRAPYKAPSAEIETISNHLSWKNIHYNRHVELL